MILQATHLSYEYGSALNPVRSALYDISFDIDQGEVVAIVGAAGSGKTTLIQHFNGLLKPCSGSMCVFGLDLADPNTDIGRIRREIGLVFQFPEVQLFAETVYEEIAFGPRNLGLTEGQIDERIRRSMAWVELDFTRFRNVSPFHLSGGEKRRIAIASVLAMEPRVIVLDEPTVGLDPRSACRVEAVLKTYQGKGRTVVFVTHDMDLVARLASRTLVLREGKLLFDGETRTFFRDAQIVNQAGLRMPRVSLFMDRLRQEGVPVRSGLLTIDEARDELKSIGRAS